MRPMLATPATARGRAAPAEVPSGAGWVHEVKWDGMRVLAEVTGSASTRLRLWSRTERDITVAFPELAGLAALGRDLLLDGEVVAMADGVPSFLALADRMHVTQARRAEQLSGRNPATYLIFDLLRLDGLDVTGLPLAERRAALESLELTGPAWQVTPTYTDGRTLLAATRDQGLEGVVSKRLDAPYRPGRRSPDWLKFPHRPTGSWVVGGWRHETESARLGSLLVGQPANRGPQGLRYRGKIGSGLAGRAGAALLEVLRPLTTDTSPFVDEVPRVDASGATWVRPEVVVDLDTLGVTGAGRLRQPSYRGRRSDVTPDDLLEQHEPQPRETGPTQPETET